MGKIEVSFYIDDSGTVLTRNSKTVTPKHETENESMDNSRMQTGFVISVLAFFALFMDYL
jgi:hypothetical protein